MDSNINHLIHTVLHNICHQITKGLSETNVNLRPPQHTVDVALDMRKAFDIVNIHKIIQRLTPTNIPNIIIKFIAYKDAFNTMAHSQNSNKSTLEYHKVSSVSNIIQHSYF